MRGALVGGVFLSIFCASSVYAAPSAPVPKDLSFQGKYVKQSIPDPIQLKAGETKQITITFKNTGTSTWNSEGRTYASLYTIQPSYRKSLFADASWIAQDNPVKLAKTTKPSETGTFTFSLTAPTTPGDYTERFQMAIENKTWVKGTGFFLKLKVQAANSTLVTTPPPAEPPPSSGDHKAQALIPSPTNIDGKGGDVSRIIVSFKNSGSTQWEQYSLKQVEGKMIRSFTGEESIGVINFADASWVNQQKVVEGTSLVEPGETLQIEFSLQNPAKRGQYLVRFELVTNNKALSGGTLSIPVTVNEDGVSVSQSIASNSSARELITEPTIRVGLYKADKEVQFQSEFSYSVYSGEELKGALSPGEKAVLNYAQGSYSFKSGDINFSSFENKSIPADPFV
jgi:hypothetical protein